MFYSATKFEVATSNDLGGDTFKENTFFDLDLGDKVTQYDAQYPLHHATYSDTKFEFSTSNGIEDTFKRNVTDARTDGRRTDFGTKLIYPFF